MRSAAGVGLDKALSTGQERENLTNVRMAPNGAEPNSFSPYRSRSRPSLTQIAGIGVRSGIPGCRRQLLAKGTTRTDLTGT